MDLCKIYFDNLWLFNDCSVGVILVVYFMGYVLLLYFCGLYICLYNYSGFVVSDCFFCIFDE